VNVITREAAKALGLKRFFTGEPCKHRHVAERFVSSGQCYGCKHNSSRRYREENPEKMREKGRRQYAANREKRREQSRRYREANPEKERERDRRYRAANLEKEQKRSRHYREANPEKEREKGRRYRAANLEKERERDRRYRAANLEKRRERERRCRAENPEKVRERDRRRWTTPIGKLIRIQRGRVIQALNSQRKSKRTMEYVGCTPQWLFDHISALLINTDFTWENFGTVWHIDHIRPLAMFDLNCEHDLLQAFSWWNLRPLSKAENLRKSAKPPTDAEMLEHYSALLGSGNFWQSIRPK
jgi:hypothetical protein